MTDTQHSFLGINDTHEERKAKLHIMDMRECPERHEFGKQSYLREEIHDKCYQCWDDVKHLFWYDICADRVKKIIGR